MFKSVVAKIRNDLKPIPDIKVNSGANYLALKFNITGNLGNEIFDMVSYIQDQCIPYSITDTGLDLTIKVDSTMLGMGDQIRLSHTIRGCLV